MSSGSPATTVSANTASARNVPTATDQKVEYLARALAELLDRNDLVVISRAPEPAHGPQPTHPAVAEPALRQLSLLTARERQVAALASQGKTNRQIARQMFLSRHTVNFHLRHVYRKLRIRSRIELALLLRA